MLLFRPPLDDRDRPIQNTETASSHSGTTQLLHSYSPAARYENAQSSQLLGNSSNAPALLNEGV